MPAAVPPRGGVENAQPADAEDVADAAPACISARFAARSFRLASRAAALSVDFSAEAGGDGSDGRDGGGRTPAAERAAVAAAAAFAATAAAAAAAGPTGFEAGLPPEPLAIFRAAANGLDAVDAAAAAAGGLPSGEGASSSGDTAEAAESGWEFGAPCCCAEAGETTAAAAVTAVVSLVATDPIHDDPVGAEEESAGGEAAAGDAGAGAGAAGAGEEAAAGAGEAAAGVPAGFAAGAAGWGGGGGAFWVSGPSDDRGAELDRGLSSITCTLRWERGDSARGYRLLTCTATPGVARALSGRGGETNRPRTLSASGE